MAKSTVNELIKALRGSLGGIVFRSMPDGSVWVSTRPDFSRRTFSKGQKSHQKRFKQAAEYARSAARTNPVYAALAAGTMKTAYNIALSDWMKAPVIHQIEQVQGRIRVRASDNVCLTRVVVTILDEQGGVLEMGEGVKGEGDWWEYTSTYTGQMIHVDARDLAENVTSASWKDNQLLSHPHPAIDHEGTVRPQLALGTK